MQEECYSRLNLEGFSVEHSRPFFGKEIFCNQEETIIQTLLSKYLQEPVTDKLKTKVYEELSAAKEKGIISVPFKVVIRKDPSGIHRDRIEVILETKL